jgi:hypothetical protein
MRLFQGIHGIMVFGKSGHWKLVLFFSCFHPAEGASGAKVSKISESWTSPKTKPEKIALIIEAQLVSTLFSRQKKYQKIWTIR